MLVVPRPTFLLDLLISVNIAAASSRGVDDDDARRERLPRLLGIPFAAPRGDDVPPRPERERHARLVLLHGYAGSVVQSFGNFVVGGNIVVGIVGFLDPDRHSVRRRDERCGTRSEVAARFSLDAMAPKLVAIDGELNSGLINEAEALSPSSQDRRSSEFYGSMDGASKFAAATPSPR